MQSVRRTNVQSWTLADSYSFIATFLRRQYTTTTADAVSDRNSNSSSNNSSSRTGVESHNHQPSRAAGPRQRHSYGRRFHDYFVTQLPVSSLHPDSRISPRGPHHKLPRSASVPYSPEESSGFSPATIQPPADGGASRETTVVRIPLRSAKHHFGAAAARGTRKTNEDTYQAGVIEIPAFAKRAPPSLTIGKGPGTQSNGTGEAGGGEEGGGGVEGSRVAQSATGDPQVFYFGVFDGHGGAECSDFLKDELHEYVQDASAEFGLESSLRQSIGRNTMGGMGSMGSGSNNNNISNNSYGRPTGEDASLTSSPLAVEQSSNNPSPGELPIIQPANRHRIGHLEKSLVSDWKRLVGGYFRRFRPSHFSYYGKDSGPPSDGVTQGLEEGSSSGASIEEAMEYAFLKADFDFIRAQASKEGDDLTRAERPLNEQDVLHNPGKPRNKMIGGPKRFRGGSTSSIAMISTPTPTPFWHPSAPSSILVSHVGDTRILLCSTATGLAIPLTMDHHPSSPIEGNRLRRYAVAFATDSFGEERIDGLANTRAFGDMQSKRIGVSAEPEIRRIEMRPAEYSFLVLMSDGVSGTLPDQEVVDIVKEAKTPDQAARDIVSFATEVSSEGDNATCLVVRLGGWERRQEGGVGSMRTKEDRDWRRQEASNPRMRRR